MITITVCIVFSILAFIIGKFGSGVVMFSKNSYKLLFYCPDNIQKKYSNFMDIVALNSSGAVYFGTYVWLAFLGNLLLSIYAPLTGNLFMLFCFMNAGVLIGGYHFVGIFRKLYETQEEVGLFDFTDTKLHKAIREIELISLAASPDDPKEALNMIKQSVQDLVNVISERNNKSK